ncbi:uncharacterized protein LOC131151572 [Malania oleifera]|uniref:uncharacterized protein LOC131151572 n=1 Tax=Malania oleifera TaxID=397392 RepID=UPI0025AEC398|nr:uncharacterized protein LOC131151572 [Malania oleifera]
MAKLFYLNLLLLLALSFSSGTMMGKSNTDGFWRSWDGDEENVRKMEEEVGLILCNGTWAASECADQQWCERTCAPCKTGSNGTLLANCTADGQCICVFHNIICTLPSGCPIIPLPV